MTDRYSGYIVTLEADIREDDAQDTIKALQQIKGVLSVEPMMANGLDEYTGRMRERAEWFRRLIKLVHDADVGN